MFFRAFFFFINKGLKNIFSSPGDFLKGKSQGCQQEKPVMDIILRNIMLKPDFQQYCESWGRKTRVLLLSGLKSLTTLYVFIQ